MRVVISQDLNLRTGAKKDKIPLDLPGLGDHLAPSIDGACFLHISPTSLR